VVIQCASECSFDRGSCDVCQVYPIGTFTPPPAPRFHACLPTTRIAFSRTRLRSVCTGIPALFLGLLATHRKTLANMETQSSIGFLYTAYTREMVLPRFLLFLPAAQILMLCCLPSAVVVRALRQ
jgi:hypothetical protein